jgi:hypothetical protein
MEAPDDRLVAICTKQALIEMMLILEYAADLPMSDFKFENAPQVIRDVLELHVRYVLTEAEPTPRGLHDSSRAYAVEQAARRPLLAATYLKGALLAFDELPKGLDAAYVEVIRSVQNFAARLRAGEERVRAMTTEATSGAAAS